MSKIIKLQSGTPAIVADEWTVLRAPEGEAGGALTQADVDAATHAIVPLAYWEANRDALLTRARAGTLAVWLAPDDEPFALQADLASLPLVAVDFPVFRDGRGYSTAFLLRQRLGFTRELRAIGDVLHADKSIDDALNGFGEIGVLYQGAIDEPRPLFRRDRASQAGVV
jgi:uncharacterized protein (DUF934 family)